jgi:hypothetical protein
MMNATIHQVQMMLDEGMVSIENEEEFSGFTVLQTPPLQEQTTLYVFKRGDKAVGMIGTRPCPEVPNSVQMVSAGVNTQQQRQGIGTTMGAYAVQKALSSGKTLVMEDDITSDSMRRIVKFLREENDKTPLEAYDTVTKEYTPVRADSSGNIITETPGLFNSVPGQVDMQKQFAPKVPERIKLVLRPQ